VITPTKKPDKYRAPTPDLGPVLWSHVPGGEQSSAIVTRAGRDAIDVIIFPPESRIGIPKSGVVYVGDPRAATMVSPESGFWDYTNESKRITKLEAVIERLVDESETVTLS
jgi:hypothetical protein